MRTEAVGLLAAGLAHDLNNMLGGIVTTAELLAARIAGGEEARDLAAIAEQAVKASALVRQILAFSRQEMLTPRPLELGAWATALQPMLAHVAGRRLALEVTADTPVTVEADPGALERVVMNLLLNARDAIVERPGGPMRGRVWIRVGPAGPAERPEAARGFMPARRYGVIRVADDGPGVHPAIAGRIFEPYFTTRAAGQGLGLSSAFGLVKQSGGFLLLEQGGAPGACFAVWLPEADARAGATGPRAAGGQVLLLVEDELLLRMSVARGLERQGWRVRQAADAEGALRRLEAERPAVMVTDIRLPGADGVALTEAARRLHPGLPVLLTSGYADAAARAAVPGLSAGFLMKPFTLKALAERLSDLVETAPPSI